ncbi:MAG: peptide chain release factor N(5)-glutamine methyltransferase [Holosporales bacterium]|nr:peptide chain release factor N(5)-glutamine methyltransferase [Holosporales bacterium]
MREELILLAGIKKSTYSMLALEKTIHLHDSEFERFKGFLKRRSNGEPIAKILQKKEFYGIEFITNENTLDPRPETELIIDLFRKHYVFSDTQLAVLDLGCGTGCIGLTILSLYKNAICDFVDISSNAMAVAEKNSTNLGVCDRSRFIVSDWFTNVSGRYDAIVSNPPYVAVGFELTDGALFDPEIALFAGDGGMNSFDVIFKSATSFMKTGAKLFMEIGFDQKDKVLALASGITLLEVVDDLAGIHRAMVFASGSV